MKKNTEMLWNNNNTTIHPAVKVVGQVHINNYDQLVNAEGQRNLSPRGIKQLTDSINDHGICSTPIAVKDKNKYVIVDGWHRISVAKRNNLDIICTLVKPQCSINNLMIILNTTQINWNIESFLNNGIVFHKNKDYIELREIWEDTGINLGALYEIYSFDLSMRNAKSRFEKGIWEMSTKALGNKIVRYAEDINKYISFSYKTNFIRGFAICVNKKGFKIKHLISQLKRFPNHIHDAGDSASTTISMLNKIYNHCCLEEEQVFLGK